MKEGIKGGLSEIESLVSGVNQELYKLVLPSNPVKILIQVVLAKIAGKTCCILIDSAYFFKSINYQGPFSRRLYFGLKKLAAKLVSGIIFSYDGAVFPSETPYITLRTFSPKTKFLLANRNGIVAHSLRKYDFGYCGRFEKEKGVLEFLELVKNYPSKRFVICGSGSLDKVIGEALVLFPNLDLTAFSDEVGAFHFYNNVRSIMILSHQEGCSLVSKEALAVGCNIIATRVLGNGPLELALEYSKGYYAEEVSLDFDFNEDIDYIDDYAMKIDIENFHLKLNSFLERCR